MPLRTYVNIDLKIWFLLMVSMTLFIMVATNSKIWAQSITENQPPLKFEVLDSATGSGSKTTNQSANEEQPEFKIEVMNVPSTNIEQAPGLPPVEADSFEAPGTGEPKGIRKPRVVTAAQKAKMSPEERAELEKEELLAALEEWHYKTLANYDYNIIAMDDPFMPIEQVRGRPEEITLDPVEEAKLPPILRLELNQLKLVAITLLSERPGGLWLLSRMGPEQVIFCGWATALAGTRAE